jgi:hypothetical protein
MKFHVTKCADDSTSYELIGKHWRLEISIEKHILDSSWYFVHINGIMWGGYIIGILHNNKGE